MSKLAYAYVLIEGRLRSIPEDETEFCKYAKVFVSCFPKRLVKFGSGRIVPILTIAQWYHVWELASNEVSKKLGLD